MVLLVASVGCGEDLLPDGPELVPAAHLTIVAHQDDDLLFMQPDLADVADRRAGLTNVYVTAGDGGGGLETAAKRYRGLQEAYAEAAGVTSTWTCGVIELAGHAADHCRLAGAPISLVFLGYPDGGKEGEKPDSLLHLFDGSVTNVETIARSPAHYDQAGLIATVAETIRITEPSTIRTLEVSATHGRDHADHMIAGALTVLAAAQHGYTGELLAFRGYAIENEPENVSGALYARSANNLAHYEACATGCGACGTACAIDTQPAHAIWLHRRYAVGLRRAVTGALRHDGRCVHLDATSGTLGLDPSCTSPDLVELTLAGELRVGGACVAVDPAGTLVAAASCEPSAATWFSLDDEGHLWSGAPLAPELVSPRHHLGCLATTGDRLAIRACGEGDAPTWVISHAPITMPRPSWLPAAGRAAAISLDRLFTVVNGELLEAPGTTLGFAAPVVRGAFPVEPESLIVGLIEAGAVLACGRSPTGILCGAVSTPEPFTFERWSPAFARSGPATASDRSLGAFGDTICGLSDEGAICTPRGSSLVSTVRSPWPEPDQPLWMANLDADPEIDWCAATPTGLACGRASDHALTTDGVPWSFSREGAVEPVPTNASLTALRDIDGDHRADLCTVEGREILCARSQGHGFGPRFSIGTLPAGAPATGLWFHLGRACVDDGATLTCIPLP
ncbi:MAG: Rhs family protein [Myxococcales bacterium]|nr:Rhs family protein [Myxococcales bacterium]